MEKSNVELSSPNKVVVKDLDSLESGKIVRQNTKVIFDVIAVQFCFSTFIRQFVSHVLIVFVPFLLENPAAQGFSFVNFLSVFFNIFAPVCLYVMILSYYMCPSSDQNILSGALWLPLIFYLQHRLVVALKYATLSESEYRRFTTCPDLQLTWHYQYQMQLLGGWLQADKDVLEFELRAAAARVGAKIRQIYFVIPSPLQSKSAISQLRNWNSFMKNIKFIDTTHQVVEELKAQADGSYQLSVYDYCFAVVRYQGETDIQGVSSMAILSFALLNLLIPYINLGLQAGDVKFSGWLVAFFATSTVLNLVFGVVVYSILFVAIFGEWGATLTRSETMKCKKKV